MGRDPGTDRPEGKRPEERWAIPLLTLLAACSGGRREPAPDALVALERGRELEAQSQLDQAVESFRSAVALDPGLADAHLALGRVLEQMSYVRVGRGGEAPGMAAHVTLGRNETLLDESIAHLERAVALAPEDAEAAHLAGRALWLRGRDEEAIALLRRAVALDPRSGEAHKRLGTVLLDCGEPEAALATLRTALTLLPADASIPFQIGNILQESDPRAARAAYEQAIASDRTFPGSHNGLATVLARLGDAEGAARARHDFEVWEKLAAQLEAAEARARRSPHDLEAQVAAGELLFAVERRDDALGYFRRAYALAPEEPLVHLYLGILLTASAPAEARGHLEESLRLVPDAAQPKLELLRLARATNDVELVKATLARIAPEVDAWEIAERRELADLLLACGRREDAAAHYVAVLARAPDDPAAAQGLARARNGAGR